MMDSNSSGGGGCGGTIVSGNAGRRCHTRQRARCAIAASAILVLACQVAYAQLPHARLNWIYPSGGQPGTQVEVTVGGADLDFAESLLFSHPGIAGEPKRPAATEFDKKPAAIPNTFTVSIGSDVPPGMYDVRVAGRFGASTPRRFVVDTLPERNEAAENQRMETAMPVAMNSAVNGRANGSGKDYYRIDLAAGQRVMIDVVAQRIDSQMDATLALLNADGTLLKRVRDNRGRDLFLDFTAAQAGSYFLEVYDFTYRGSENHFYRLSVTGRPRIDYVFPPSVLAGTTCRVTLWGRKLPGGSVTDVKAADGVPLERLDRDIAAPLAASVRHADAGNAMREPAAVDVRQFFYRLPSDAGPSNTVAIGLATQQVIAEQEPNDREQPQRVNVPCEYVGQFFPRRDEDWIEFEARKGDVYWIEMYSERTGLSTDAYLMVQRVAMDEQGQTTLHDVAEADDSEKRPGAAGYNQPTQDPALRFQAPEDGRYRILVRDNNSMSRADLRNVYRLSLRRPWPDFDLLVASSSPFSPDPEQPQRWNAMVRRGGTTALTVSAIRRDGFDQPIHLQLQGLPAGVTCQPTVIGANHNEGVLVVEADESAAAWHGPIRVVGRALVDGRQVERVARGATLAWDAPSKNARTLPRLTDRIVMSVAPEVAPALVTIDPAIPLKATRGGKLSVPFQVAKRSEFKENLTLAPLSLPKGVQAEVKLAEDGAKGTLELSVGEDVTPGMHTSALAGKTKISYQRNPEALKEAEQRKAELTATVEMLTQAVQQHQQALAQATAAVPPAAARTEGTDSQLAAAENKDAQAEPTGSSEEAAPLEQATRVAEERLKAAKEALQQAEERVKQLTEVNKPVDAAIDLVSTPITFTVTSE